MTTAKIDHVAYIGWKGMNGCEVIDFGTEMTGFIGAGGAGKSTMLIALDYALLPDRRSLNIRSISDLEDTHTSGIDPMLGRIDAQYGYAYVILDITTRHNKRLIAGIYASPEDGTVSFKNWLIKNPPKDIKVDELMRCHDGDKIYYPEFSTLERKLAVDGIDVTTCKVIGDYGQALYDAGILPGPMNSTSDRKLFGNLLDTTFRGGISKDVAVHLKDYLLPAQTMVQDLVKGLQQCTNEVLTTRHAVADADRELALLESTYGIGRDAVLTAIRGITDDIETSESSLKALHSELANKNTTSQSLSDSIPTLKTSIETTEATKNTTLNAKLSKSRELGDDKGKARLAHDQSKVLMDAANIKLKQFNEGGKLWKDNVSQHVQNGTFDDAQKWLDSEFQAIQREIFETEGKIKDYLAEDERLSNDKASAASEHLAELLGAQTLEQALGNVSDKEAIALEMSMGGLIEGVVGVSIDSLSEISPSPDLPTMFWLGEAAPTALAPKETGDWYITATSGGFIVASKDKSPIFGREARQQRRVVIATEVTRLKGKCFTKQKEAEGFDAKKTLLLKNHQNITLYLDHRSDALTLDKVARDAQETFKKHKETLEIVERQHSEILDEIAQMQEPFNLQIREFRVQLSTAEKAHAALQVAISGLQMRIDTENKGYKTYQEELEHAKAILGDEFSRFHTACMDLPPTPSNVSAQQTQRITVLARTLGKDAEQLASFHEIAADKRVSVIRIWPDLMDIVRESINVDLADSDGYDLIQEMRDQRSRLDIDLKTWENELGIKAKNIYMTITGNVRSHEKKIKNLSLLGQVIEFGHVTGIQIKLVHREKMIKALEQFANKLTLFSSDKPVDQLLKEFFEATIVGGVKQTGEELLDYRNYVDLVIEARREGSDKWELASSLSGTEVIGGGLAIALMLVRSIAARGEASGTGVKASEIRPIFAVDEVGRINPEGQKLLADFARREHFQLVVTAPAIKPTYDCILYALTRTFQPREQLIVRGIKHRVPVEPMAA